ncbi:MAG: TonB-dependent receptor [Sphingobium sp.]|uniref:TonB-dependent receptor n=1 Tax=Sphingobium sp. TaxID=1912891 RepID=UPI0029B60C6B|nr:TonB-dependent receptor [Sphingobium sp.]MDX3911692.1 TonB-dependent receptor [Sphingobium sp.]
MHHFIGLSAVGPLAALLALPVVAHGQSTTSGQENTSSVAAAESAISDDIVVTARRRGEQSLNVPVVVTAFSAEQLVRAGVNSISDIARLTPQLTAEAHIGSFGGFTALRGVTSPSSNTATDPAVLTVVNNVPVGTGGANRLGQFDLGQAEILKGPQALFFGKNATGGIISLTSAEPTHIVETLVRSEYEVRAAELQVLGVVSGPLTDNLLARFAVKGLGQRGFLYNDAPGAYHDRGPRVRDFATRGTLIYSPESSFTAKLKVTYNLTRDHGPQDTVQRMYCPAGVPTGSQAIPGIADCTLNDHFVRANLPPNLDTLTGNSLFRTDGSRYSRFEQFLSSLDLNYQVASGISLTSISGLYHLNSKYSDNNVGGLPTLSVAGSNKRTVFSQELRLASDTGSDAPFSWMVGGFYQHDSLDDTEQVVRYAPTTNVFAVSPRSVWNVKGESLSAFAQGSVKFLSDFSFSAGVRYSKDVKTQDVNLSDKFVPRRKFTDVSPEFTLSYQPSRNINVFASFKEAYKSGSFQVTSLGFLGPIANPATITIDNSYNPETVSGFEGGIKAALFDRQLRVEASVYNYLYKDLQLSVLDPVLSTNRISNAAAARVKGAELSFNFAPSSIPSLRLFTALAYNKGRYKDFIATCFVGQTIAQGCTIDGPDAGTVPDLQSFTGRPMFKAPKLSGNIGFSLNREVGSDLSIGLNGQALYQSKSFLAQEEAPWGIRRETVLLDAGFSLGASNRRWEVGVIGKNLTNNRYPIHGAQESNTGNPATTGTTVGVPSDYNGYVSRGREVRLYVTFRPNLF